VEIRNRRSKQDSFVPVAETVARIQALLLQTEGG